MSDLIERLRRRSEIMEALGDTTVELKGAWVLESQLTLAQGAKDNAEAADRIEALEREAEELRNQLKTAEQLRVFWNDKAIELAARFIPSARIKAEGREATNDSP